jgi:hypothetical protein
MRSTHSSDFRGRNAEVTPEEARKLSLAEAYARCERLSVIVVQGNRLRSSATPEKHPPTFRSRGRSG